ncbi:transglycosylase SLT domain-containing protein [Escherichia coli]|nr:transglycosylase SLT domain-containing protein [Escherichia coli]
MKNVLLVGLLALTSSVIAQDCFEMAGRDYHIEPDLLRAISFRESSWLPDAMNVVSNESYAVGMMQIHSQNFSHLAQYGITPGNLYRDPCMNIYTGAYYLAIAFKRWGYSWRAVGAYNAGFRETEAQERKRQKYAQEIQAIYVGIKKNAPPE